MVNNLFKREKRKQKSVVKEEGFEI